MPSKKEVVWVVERRWGKKWHRTLAFFDTSKDAIQCRNGYRKSIPEDAFRVSKYVREERDK